MQITNRGFKKSKVRIKMILHCVELYPLREHKSNFEMLQNFAKYKVSISVNIVRVAGISTLINADHSQRIAWIKRHGILNGTRQAIHRPGIH